MELRVKELQDASSLSSFSCGIPAMDNFIHSNLTLSVIHNYCKLFSVIDVNNTIVAMFALSFDSLRLDFDDKDDLQQDFSSTSSPTLESEYEETFWCKAHYPALEIAYLAVAKEYQHQHLGKDIIELIIEKAKTQSIGGCQFITVEAYCTKEYSAVGFYTRCGFAQVDLVAKYDTIRMYRNLLE